MAKKIKTETYDIDITTKTKDAVYVIDKSIANKATVTIKPKDNVYSEVTTKKDSNDLIIVSTYYSLLDEEQILAGSSVTTIKDYFKYANSDHPLVYIKEGDNDPQPQWTNAKACSDNGIVLAHGKVEGTLSSIYGDKKATTYSNITTVNASDNPHEFYELGGNDKYDFKTATPTIVYDLTGNDKYTSASTTVSFIDYKGKDNYSFATGSAGVFDYKGNDKYTVNSEAQATITDYEGADKYNVNNNSDSTTVDIADYSGKDKYTIQNVATVRIMDGVNGESSHYATYSGKSGNDTYTFTSSEDFTVTDMEGNDTYKFLDKSSNKNISLIVDQDIHDFEGNDKYTFTDSDTIVVNDEKGKDTYTLNGSSDITIYEGEGDDTYKFSKGSRGIAVTDDFGADNYKLNGTKTAMLNNVTVTDNSESNDKYNLSYGVLFNISDEGGDDKYSVGAWASGTTIEDVEGKDSYTITSLALGTDIEDQAGDDTYNVAATASATRITDGGGNDTLVLSGTKEKNIVCMSSYEELDLGSLILFNQAKGTFVRINDYYNVKTDAEEKPYYEGFGAGKIETIKAGKKAMSNIPATFTAEIMAQVSDFLSTSGEYDSIEDVLQSDSETDIKTLIGIFEGKGNLA